MASQEFYLLARKIIPPLLNEMSAAVLPKDCRWTIHEVADALVAQIERNDRNAETWDSANAVCISREDYLRLARICSSWGMPTMEFDGDEPKIEKQPNLLGHTFDDGKEIAPMIRHPNLRFFEDYAAKMGAALKATARGAAAAQPKDPETAPAQP